MNKPGHTGTPSTNRESYRRDLEIQLMRLGRRRNRIGGAGAGGGFIIGSSIFALRRYLFSPAEAMQSPLVVATAIGLAAGVAGVILLGSYVVRLNTRIERISAELMMIEVRG